MKNLFILIFLSACSQFLVKDIPQDAYQRLCFLGDTGRGNTMQANVARALEAEQCHGVFFTGDIIYKNGLKSADDPEVERLFFKYYRPLAENGHRPKLHLVMGNHDHQGNVDAWKIIAQKESIIHFPELFWFKNLGGACVVGIDSDFQDFRDHPEWKTRQDKFMSELNLNDCKVKIAIAHHPWKTSGSRKNNAIRPSWEEFYKRFIVGKFDYFIAGHEHILTFEGEEQGTRLFISGAGGKPDAGRNPGHLVLDVMDKEHRELRVKLKEISWGKLKEKEYWWRR